MHSFLGINHEYGGTIKGKTTGKIPPPWGYQRESSLPDTEPGEPLGEGFKAALLPGSAPINTKTAK
jgi:hypothetical protein